MSAVTSESKVRAVAKQATLLYVIDKLYVDT